MRILILTMLIISTHSKAGSLLILDNNGVTIYDHCESVYQTHSDIQGQPSEYFLNCDNNIQLNPISVNYLPKSNLYINNDLMFSCPVETSIFGTGNGFYIFMICKQEVLFKNSFD